MTGSDKDEITRYLIVIKSKIFSSQGRSHRLFIKALFLCYFTGQDTPMSIIDERRRPWNPLDFGSCLISSRR